MIIDVSIMKRLLTHGSLSPLSTTAATMRTVRLNRHHPVCFFNTIPPVGRRLSHNSSSDPTTTTKTTKTTTSSSPPVVGDSTAAAFSSDASGATTTKGDKDENVLLEKFLRAPFQKQVGGAKQPGILFPWRHSSEPLPRLVHGTPEYESQGLLMGGNLETSNPKMDAMATAKFFLGVPWYKMLFYSHWKADLADNMTWAFSQGTATLLSTVYNLPFDRIVGDTNNLLDIRFDTGADTLPREQNGDGNDGDIPKQEVQDVPKLDVHNVMEGQLVELFESARQFGKDTLQVRLEVRRSSLPASIVCLSVLPFLSRAKLNHHLGYKRRYQRMLNLMANDDVSDALAIVQEFMGEFQQRKVTEHTVICQVLIPCEEVFCVRDSSTGQIVQGNADEKFRTVYHLVRFEQVVTTHLINDGKGFFPFRMEQGNWLITDIDDLLGGNLLL